MITLDDVKKIQQLKSKRYSQAKVGKMLNVSTATVSRYWGPKGLKLDDLFLVDKCSNCGIVYPKPKFLGSWETPCCGKTFKWEKRWFNKED